MTALLLLLLGSEAVSLRCDNYLATAGATKLEVIANCGEPDWRERISGRDERSEEIWIYDRPAAGSQLLLHFDGVELRQLRRERRNASTRGADTFRCGNSLVRPGNTKLTVRERCGEPELVEKISGSEEAQREVWLYRRQQTTVSLEFRGVELIGIDRRIR